MRRLEGNVIWQVVVVYSGDQAHSLPYLKDQCLADLKSLRSLVQNTPIPAQTRKVRREVKPSQIGEIVKRARENSGQNQIEAAAEIGISQPMLSRIETGATKRIINDTREKLLAYHRRHRRPELSKERETALNRSDKTA